jgi:hypothetical protein
MRRSGDVEEQLIGLTIRGVLVAAVGTALALSGESWLARPAGAIELAVAKKCLALTMEEYPRPKGYAAYKPGHPGTAKAREVYYRDCVAKDGNVAVAEPKQQDAGR